MSQSGAGHVSALARNRRDRAMLGVVLLLVFGFSYSADLVAWVFEIVDLDTTVAWGIGLVGIDAVILVAVGLLKRVIGRIEGGESRLWRTWWTAFGIVAALNVTIAALPKDHPLWVDLLASLGFAAILGVHYLLTRTSFGLRLQILGANPRAAKHMGVNLTRVIVISFLISGALIGAASAADILGLWGYARANWNPAYGDTVIPALR